MKHKSSLKFGMCITIFVAIAIGCAKDEGNRGANPVPQPGITVTHDGHNLNIANNCKDTVVPPHSSNATKEEYCAYLKNESVWNGCEWAARKTYYRQACLGPPVEIPDGEERIVLSRGVRDERKPSPIYSETEIRSNRKTVALKNETAEQRNMRIFQEFGLCDPAKPYPVISQKELATVNINNCGRYKYLPDTPTVGIPLYLDKSSPILQGVVSEEILKEACVCLVDYRLQTTRQSSAMYREKLIEFCRDMNPAPKCVTTQTSNSTSVDCNPPAPVAPIKVDVPVVAVPQPTIAQNACLPLINRAEKVNVGSVFNSCADDKCKTRVTTFIKNIVDKIGALKNSDLRISTRIKNADYRRCESLSSQLDRVNCVLEPQKSKYVLERSFHEAVIFGCDDYNKTEASNECRDFYQIVIKAINDSAGRDMNSDETSNKDVCPIKSIISNGDDSILLNGQQVKITSFEQKQGVHQTIIGHYVDQRAEVWISLLPNNEVHVTTFFDQVVNGISKKVAVGYHVGFIDYSRVGPAGDKAPSSKKAQPKLKSIIKNDKCETCVTPAEQPKAESKPAADASVIAPATQTKAAPAAQAKPAPVESAKRQAAKAKEEKKEEVIVPQAVKAAPAPAVQAKPATTAPVQKANKAAAAKAAANAEPAEVRNGNITSEVEVP